jgi:predicted Holliday junction resolvase-like endonuclease
MGTISNVLLVVVMFLMIVLLAMQIQIRQLMQKIDEHLSESDGTTSLQKHGEATSALKPNSQESSD